MAASVDQVGCGVYSQIFADICCVQVALRVAWGALSFQCKWANVQ
jgi:hypothetical protein